MTEEANLQSGDAGSVSTGPPSGPIPDSPSGGAETYSPSGLKPAEARTAVEHMMSIGKIDLAEANGLLAADGLPPIAEKPVETNLHVAHLEAAFPVAPSEAFRLPRMFDEDENVSPGEIKRRSEIVAGYLTAGEMTKEHGSTLAEKGAEFSEKWLRASDADKKILRQSQDAIKVQVLGPKARERLEVGVEYLDYIESKKPGFLEFLERSGAANSAFFAVKLVEAAEIWKEKKTARGK